MTLNYKLTLFQLQNILQLKDVCLNKSTLFATVTKMDLILEVNFFVCLFLS